MREFLLQDDGVFLLVLEEAGAKAMDSIDKVDDKRLLEAAAAGQTDLVLQLLEEDGGQHLHSYKDQASRGKKD